MPTAVERHFPILMGRLPGLFISIPGYLTAAVKRFAVELALMVPFVILFVATIACAWDGVFRFHALATATAVLPLSYLVTLLMVRQR